jgi:papain like protease
MSRFSRGLKRTTPSKVAHRLKAHLHPAIAAALRTGPRGSAQLTPCPRMDQGATGTCHAHSCGAAIYTAFTAAGKGLSFVPSPRMIASCTYADVRASSLAPGANLPPLTDDGAELQDDATAVANWGVAPIQSPTSDGRYSDVENDPPNNIFPEPDPMQLQMGAQDLISGEYSIAVDKNAPLTVAASLDSNIPVWVGFVVDSAFENLGQYDVAQAPNTNDQNGGGHAVYLSGYRTSSGGSLEFRLENSWGSGWGDSGAVWCSTAWLLATWDLFPMTVVS